MHKREQIKAIRLHINCRRKRWYQRTPLPILRYQHNTSITSKKQTSDGLLEERREV